MAKVTIRYGPATGNLLTQRSAPGQVAEDNKYAKHRDANRRAKNKAARQARKRGS